MSRLPLSRALISVHDKTGVVELARALAARGCELVSTGGTARLLREKGLAVRDVSELTGFPEMMDGRVKTLHPRIHGGLLARRDHPEDLALAAANGISLIDLVVVTLYPFAEVSRRPGASLADLVENIDIGGPSLLRGAAKNHAFVTVLCDTADYGPLLEQLEQGGPDLAFRRRLAAKAYARTAAYDGLIASVLGERFEREAGGEGAAPVLPPVHSLTLPRVQDLRYGENPHQAAAVYGSLAGLEILHGKALSYNNLLDVDAALELIGDFPAAEGPACAILKHTNPCGAALGATALEAFQRALATDQVSPFGGIVVWNRPLDAATARVVHPLFMEILIAPAFDEEALAILRKKKDRRLLACGPLPGPDLQLRHFFGGLLVQGRDRLAAEDPAAYRCVTKRQPSAEERSNLLFAWRIVRHVKSNAIVLAREGRTLGIGAGQMSRVDASDVAVLKARREGHELAGGALGSDAFFPFPDGIAAAAAAGITAVIQPGGSVRDEEVIRAADEAGLAMLFTDRRHFRH
ncbi:MAG: bifunctional phosphoribosylaminoimidazolecarboxamide formyltransferase/IMP cyclohydrolase [bacterium]|jgi:phosphoribosylaminoimidazolecarboxamide formyltransferase/IMP cyclohydrolase|nr:bifunctional phosphoribosylaminoimidazolecarboxamide formyltransferase/IMP cyclohydrolase [bacterium]